mmetsp:Transcript_86615/g.250131  ORF Transcript_86615/g.250131 Transcript_86615/m.250131 type:complete len:889 (+) Transcript_86615:111-2777(+)
MAKVAPAPLDSSAVHVKGAKIEDVGTRAGGSSAKSCERGTVDHKAGSTSMVYRARHVMRDAFLDLGWYESRSAVYIRKLLRGKVFAGVAMVSLMLALFLGEAFTVAQVSSNTASDVILTIVFAVFAGEFLGLTLTDASYLFSFFFWMDLLGTVSMVFDISYMAGTDVSAAVSITQASSGREQENVIITRAARATKLGARAGRISRVLKILRFLPFLLKSDGADKKVKMAKVISNQLTNALSVRVAFLTICIVIVMPLFTMFTYPEFDDSMGAWTELLSLNAQAFHEALAASNDTAVSIARQRLFDEVARCASFYSDNTYGPFFIEYGESLQDHTFRARPDVLEIDTSALTFAAPRRSASARIVSQGRVRMYFDLSMPNVVEAAANVGLICFIIIVMCGFGLVTSSSISVMALQPLERMLSVVRERCKEIFKYTVNLKDDETDSEEDYDDMEHVSEFALLEKAVSKLTAIAQLSAVAREPELKQNMDENEIMVLNWMQGTQFVGLRNTESRSRGPTVEMDELVTGTGKAYIDVVPKAVLESLETEHFNPLDLSQEVKTSLAVYMVKTTESCAGWVRSYVREDRLINFVNIVEAKYLPNPFHNFAHAIDVAYTIRRQMKLIRASSFLSDVQQFWILIAAIGHDLAHPGVNNQYLVETAHELAVRYNDRSPLENMHCARLFQIANDLEANIFSQIEKDVYKEMRKGMINAILHTDVTKHNEMIKELGMLYQINQDAFDRLEPAEAILRTQGTTQLVLNSLLHGADVGNLMKPWELCQRYAHLCLDEFFAQGDMEKAAGIPVQMLNDRDKVNRPNSQIGFIEFVIAPMVNAQVTMFPQLDRMAHHLGENIQSWARVWEQQVAPSAEEVGKVKARVQKVAAAMKALRRTSDEA